MLQLWYNQHKLYRQTYTMQGCCDWWWWWWWWLRRCTFRPYWRIWCE